MMKQRKILDLAAVAAVAAAAFAGAATASAGMLYKEAVTQGLTVEITASLKEKTSAKFVSTAQAPLTECNGSTLKSKIENAGTATTPVLAGVPAANLAWTGTNCANVATLEGGELEIEWIPATINGKVKAKKFKITLKLGGVSCTYTAGSGTTIGELTGAEFINASFDINAILGLLPEESFLCPKSVIWTATYVVSSPAPLHVTEA